MTTHRPSAAYLRIGLSLVMASFTSGPQTCSTQRCDRVPVKGPALLTHGVEKISEQRLGARALDRGVLHHRRIDSVVDQPESAYFLIGRQPAFRLQVAPASQGPLVSRCSRCI